MAQYLPELNNIRQDFFAPSIHKVSEGVKRLDCWPAFLFVLCFTVIWTEDRKRGVGWAQNPDRRGLNNLWELERYHQTWC